MKDYKIEPGAKIKLAKYKTKAEGDLTKESAFVEFEDLRQRLVGLQELLYAENKHSLLIVLEAMDTGGKDSIIQKIFSGVNPQGCVVTSFKEPSTVELAHDFLWRIHQQAPRLGMIGIFNRSYYEDVLIARVKELVPKKRWERRYQHINAFEEMLHDEGTVICKFFLHISKEYQKERLQRRLEKPDKLWKFSPEDLKDRERWNDYQEAYAAILERCSTKYAPWYIIPAEKHWYRDLVVLRILVETLEALKMKYPQITFDPKKIVIK